MAMFIFGAVDTIIGFFVKLIILMLCFAVFMSTMKFCIPKPIRFMFKVWYRTVKWVFKRVIKDLRFLYTHFTGKEIDEEEKDPKPCRKSNPKVSAFYGKHNRKANNGTKKKDDSKVESKKIAVIDTDTGEILN